ncbi:hypothetical protein [Planomonospora venezuelensis]|uniref:Uncharacterized protein n=1 Tax=Planomonospora venezuelensis TaxID=1999 RepID=A0A841CX98_PLAVE|nr:hypothetical protein [Planomonospora venezuelensis]MBB5960944.1 hypothetical protein [Planomonospora venezuelensis]GIN01178.1 hypothetical protein Pve01_28360 [Planomonospora venezuelensis]
MWPPSSPQDPQGQQPPGGPGQPPAGPWQSPQQPPYGQQLPPFQQSQPQPTIPYRPQDQPYNPGQQPYNPGQQPYNPQGQQQGPGGPWYPQGGPPKRKPVWPWVVGVAVAVVVALVVVFVVVLPGDSGKPTAGSSTAPTAAASSPADPSGEPTAAQTEQSSPPAVPDGRTVTSTDGKSQLTIPADWETLSLLNEADVQVGNQAKEQYLMVITEDKASFDLDLAGYGKLVIEQMQTKLTNTSAGEPQQLTINGAPAIQYELHGTAQGVRITYWVTLVQGAADFHQVLTWTLETKGEEHGPLLRDVTATFKDLGA